MITDQVIKVDRSELSSVPRPLPETVQSVSELDGVMLPSVIWDFVADVADRQQSPADFVAVAGLCALSGVIGRKVLIQPKLLDDEWRIVANLWGALIGKPSSMKTPTLKSASNPLNALEAEAREEYSKAVKAARAQNKLNTMEVDRLEKEAKGAGKDHQKARHLIEQAIEIEFDGDSSTPHQRRLIVNDVTVEKLGELLNESPNGVLLQRDELSGWLARMNASDAGVDRAFYLEAYNGDGSYTYDRIGRGTVRIESATLALIGGIQPSKLAPLVRAAANGQNDDGLIQRLQLAVWPDLSSTWEWRDRKPCPRAKAEYMALFKRLDDMPRYDPDIPDVPVIAFDSDAQGLFKEWTTNLHVGIRTTKDMNQAFESHLLKMPQTVARLAGIFALIEGVSTVREVDMLRALAFSDYLRSHAEKIYSLATTGFIDAAKLILERRNKLPLPFTARDVRQKGWTGLSAPNEVNDALGLLLDHGWIISTESEVLDTGGRPTITYRFLDVQS